MVNLGKETILPNGLRVLYIEQKGLKDSGLGVAVPSGPYWERESELGVSHLLEHLISRSSTGEGDLRDEIYKKGGFFDAATTISQTYFFLYSLNEDFLDCTSSLIKGIFYPGFSDGALNQSKESVISEMAHSQKLTVYEALRNMIWEDKKLKRPLLGEKETILSMQINDVVRYHAERYLKLGVSAVVIGPRFPLSLEKTLSKINLETRGDESIISTATKSPGYGIFEGGNTHTTLTFAFPTRGYKNLGEDRHIFRLAASVLNSVYISELAKSGLVYQSNWSWNVFPDSGEFVLEFGDLAPEHVLAVCRTATKLVDNWPELSVSESEFRLIKKQRILAIRMVESLSESLPLLTKDFSSSEEAHTPEDAIAVYHEAKLPRTLSRAKKILLTPKPFLVVDMGDDSVKYAVELKMFLDEYYNG